ncbi:MAG: PorV/PorQ family protein [Candidatus Saganbacteria bacterium]|nr:PorV/PorQ family protein [Candidatus Saganbacteria bacterium]
MGCESMKIINNKLQTTNNIKVPNLKFQTFHALKNGTLVLFVIWCLGFGNLSHAQTTFDPLIISVGARAMGMGRAYVAVAEEGDTIFTNPAGLGEIDAFNFTSMAGVLLENVNYTVLGGVYPLGEKTAVGIGYAGAHIGGIEMRDISGNFEKNTSFVNNVYFASLGRKLSDKFSLGLNLKYFSQNAPDDNNGSGTGVNLDIGVLQKGWEWISFGVVAQNILVSSKIHYTSGQTEDLPFILKVGTRMYLLGEEFESARISAIKLVTSADAHINLRETQPTTAHLGLELSPNNFLTFRAGLDQDPKPGGVQNNLTYGLSLTLAGLGFHYAYHPYTEALNSSTNYFSISFNEGGWPPEGLPDIFLGEQNTPAIAKLPSL